MSLLDRGNEEVVVFLEVTETDEDGNTRTRPSTTGVVTRATIQVKNQSGTSSRRSEQDNEGYETEAVYRVRFPRSFPYSIGAQSQLEWRGVRWAMFGDFAVFNGSRRTAHRDYSIKRY